MADFLCNPCPLHYGWTAELTWVGPGFTFLSCLFLFFVVVFKKKKSKKKKTHLGMDVSNQTFFVRP